MFIVSNSSLITRINQNTKQSLNATINDLLTIFSNDMHGRIPAYLERFIRDAYDFQKITGHSWCNEDFPRYSKNYFRQIKHKLSPIITKVIEGRPSFYKLNHTYIDESLTIKDRGVDHFRPDLDFIKILTELKQQPVQWHDIRIETRSNLYDYLKITHKVNSHNGAVTIVIPTDSRFSVKVNVYKTKLCYMIGCSNNPLPFSPDGIFELGVLIGKTLEFLALRAKSDFIYEPVPNWLVTYYHFNRDGVIIDTPLHHHTITDLQKNTVFYLKTFDDGTKRFRYEEHISSPKTINESQEEFK